MSQVYNDDDTTVSVNAANGRLFVEARDVKPTAGDDNLAMTRYYNGVDDGPLSFNNRWSLSVDDVYLDTRVLSAPVLHGPSGYEVTFTAQPDGTLKAPAGFWGILARSGTQYRLRSFGRDTLSFDTTGKLLGTYDAAGIFKPVTFDTYGRLATYGRTNAKAVVRYADSAPPNGLMSRSSASLSDVIDPRIRSITEPLGTQPGQGHYYNYSGNGMLTSYQDAKGTTTYAYSGLDLTRVQRPDGTVVTIGYDASHRVSTYAVARPGVATESGAYAYGTGQTTETEPDGGQLVFFTDSDLRVVRTIALDATVDAGGTDPATVDWDWDRDATKDDEQFTSHAFRWRRVGGTWSALTTDATSARDVPGLHVGDVIEVEVQSRLSTGTLLPTVSARLTVHDDAIEDDDDGDPGSEADEAVYPDDPSSPQACVDYRHDVEDEEVTYDANGAIVGRQTVVHSVCGGTSTLAASSLRNCGNRLRQGSRFATGRYTRTRVTKHYTNPAVRYHFHIQARTRYRLAAWYSELEILRRLPDAKKRTRIFSHRPQSPGKPIAWYVHSSPHVALGGKITYNLYVRFFPETVVVQVITLPNGNTLTIYRKGSIFKGECRAA
jgi:hypothetical protein